MSIATFRKELDVLARVTPAKHPELYAGLEGVALRLQLAHEATKSYRLEYERGETWFWQKSTLRNMLADFIRQLT